MCTNPRLVSTLQCYLDDLVDCFEDFVTKSLVIISLAIGAVVIMIGYCLKAMTEQNLILQSSTRHPGLISMVPDSRGRLSGTDPTALNYSFSTQSADESTPISDTRSQNIYSENIRKSRSSTQKSRNGINMSYVNSHFENASSGTDSRSYTPDTNGNSTSNFDERVIRTVGLSNFKEDDSKRSMKRDDSCSRAQLRSVPTCIKSHHLSTPRECARSLLKKTSCCSMCCADDDRL